MRLDRGAADQKWPTKAWIPSDAEAVRQWFGSYARTTPVRVGDLTDDVSVNQVILVGDRRQPIRFYGGGYPVSAPAIVAGHNLNRRLAKFVAPNNLPGLRVTLNLAILLSPNENRSSIVGDLEERYRKIAAAEGRRAANRWFWREVIHSFLSLAFNALKRISGLEKLCRRIGG